MEYASDEARRLVQTMRGCHHGRTWAVYCRDCEIVGLRQTYADSIRRARNAERRLLAMGEVGNPPDVRADVRAADEIERLRAELAELRRFRKAIMDYDSNLYDALADSDAAHKGEGE